MYAQACRTFHPLAAFTKTKRTCDNRLKRKRERYYHGHKKGKTGEEGQVRCSLFFFPVFFPSRCANIKKKTFGNPSEWRD